MFRSSGPTNTFRSDIWSGAIEKSMERSINEGYDGTATSANNCAGLYIRTWLHFQRCVYACILFSPRSLSARGPTFHPTIDRLRLEALKICLPILQIITWIFFVFRLIFYLIVDILQLETLKICLSTLQIIILFFLRFRQLLSRKSLILKMILISQDMLYGMTVLVNTNTRQYTKDEILKLTIKQLYNVEKENKQLYN